MYEEHIRAAARSMAENMQRSPVPMYGKGLRLPDKGAVIGLLKEIRRLVFPAYYGDPELMTLLAEDYTALLLERIEGQLTRQIALALPEEQEQRAPMLARELELLGVAEMLKNLTVFIGNCNFHHGFSFTIFTCFFRVASLHPAAAAAVGCLLSPADAVVSPGDVQRFPVDKTRCNLAPCAFVNLLHGRAGNVHLCGTLLVGFLLQVNQPNDLVLVQRQQDRLGILAPVGAEGINLWCAANPTASWRSWHGYAPLFSVYTDYSVLNRKKQYSFQKPLQFPSSYRYGLIFGVENCV